MYKHENKVNSLNRKGLGSSYFSSYNKNNEISSYFSFS